MAHRLRGKILAFIRSQRVARLASVGPDGTPHNVPICPVVLSSKIYFASERDARKVRNIQQNPRVALAFDHYGENWQRLAGVMIVGTGVVSAQGAMFRRARQALYRKYRQYARISPISEGDSVIVCVTPTASYSWGL
ncbi:MAG TPA: pyridoxamine 5'-phosphate oxidase family protein [Candidatus Margulisiibacteriota bacterium]|nr:pyridoxamine 5'-phosphate oxidase family protein [Candidatus Margulisiibacteriota bacterium]